MSVMQAVISCQKLIDRPGAEDALLRLVHLQMNFVPRPVMENHNGHKDRRPLPGYQCNKRSKWNSLDRRLAHSQPYLLIFTTSDRFIAEYLGVMLVMQKSVSLKYALERRSTRTEEVLSVHELPVYLVLDKRRQNARENEPATNLQNKHQRSLDAPEGLPGEAPCQVAFGSSAAWPECRFVLSLYSASLNGDVLTLDVVQLAQALTEGLETALSPDVRKLTRR